MQISILGAGKMGTAFVRRLLPAEHDVTLASRNLQQAQAVASLFGDSVPAVPREQLAQGCDALIACTPFETQVDALRASGSLQGKVVVDICNPVNADMSGLLVGQDTSAAEQIAQALPGARVVKAFNTVFADVLSEGPALARGKRAACFCASDDAEAKTVVQRLAASMGFDAIDAGPLKNARLLEPMGLLNIYFGYQAGLGTRIAPTWLTKSPAVP